MSDLLEVRDLRRGFGGVVAVDGVSLTVRLGSATGLIGPNGAGKSTLLGIVAGAVKPAAGSVHFGGRDVTGAAPAAVARSGLIRTFQSGGEFAGLTVLENLLVAAPGQRGESLAGALLAGRRAWRRQEDDLVARARDLLGRFDLAGRQDEYAGNLSGGQKRLLEISRALMARPRMLLLDEPMAGVNPSLARRIEDHLARLNREEGLTMLMVEHELGVVERLCDRVVVMALGAVIAEGTMAEVREEQRVIDAYLAG